MKLTPMLSALLIAAIPMAAQASALTMQLNDPLSTSRQVTTPGAVAPATEMMGSGPVEHAGDSTAMANARARLTAKPPQVTDYDVTGDPLKPASEATT